MKRYLGSTAVARRLSLSPSGLTLAQRRGDLKPAALTDSGARLFDPGDVETYALARAARRRDRRSVSTIDGDGRAA